MGSYGDAWRTFGASQSLIDDLYRGPLDEKPSETTDEIRAMDSGASVSIRGRASNLLYAVKNLAEASSKEGLIYAIETDHPSVRGKFDYSDTPRLRIKADRCNTIGKNALKNAYGDPEALIKAGFDRETVESDMDDNTEEFVVENIGSGPEQKRNLAKLRKSQKRHLK